MLLLTEPLAASAARKNDNVSQHCRSVPVTVHLAADDPTTYRLDTELCWRGRLDGKTVQLTVPGFTYGPQYWDFPFQPERYSYVRAVTRAGFATLNVNRALSPVPPAAVVTIPAQAYALRQLVDALHAGQIARTRFASVIGVGHSMGAAMLLIAAADYDGFSGLILADYLHQVNPAAAQRIAQLNGPAQLNAQFAQLPAGYLSSLPGTQNRLDSYYNPASVSSRVVAIDEQYKQAGTVGEMSTVHVARAPAYSLGTTVPVLLVVGEKDSLACDDQTPGLSCATAAVVLDRERSYFGPAAAVEAFVLPMSGHDTNLHFGAERWFNAAIEWAGRRVESSCAHRRSPSR